MPPSYLIIDALIKLCKLILPLLIIRLVSIDTFDEYAQSLIYASIALSITDIGFTVTQIKYLSSGVGSKLETYLIKIFGILSSFAIFTIITIDIVNTYLSIVFLYVASNSMADAISNIRRLEKDFKIEAAIKLLPLIIFVGSLLYLRNSDNLLENSLKITLIISLLLFFINIFLDKSNVYITKDKLMFWSKNVSRLFPISFLSLFSGNIYLIYLSKVFLTINYGSLVIGLMMFNGAVLLNNSYNQYFYAALESENETKQYLSFNQYLANPIIFLILFFLFSITLAYIMPIIFPLHYLDHIANYHWFISAYAILHFNTLMMSTWNVFLNNYKLNFMSEFIGLCGLYISSQIISIFLEINFVFPVSLSIYIACKYLYLKSHATNPKVELTR